MALDLDDGQRRSLRRAPDPGVVDPRPLGYPGTRAQNRDVAPGTKSAMSETIVTILLTIAQRA